MVRGEIKYKSMCKYLIYSQVFFCCFFFFEKSRNCECGACELMISIDKFIEYKYLVVVGLE